MPKRWAKLRGVFILTTALVLCVYLAIQHFHHVPAEDVPAEDVPAEEVPAEEAPAEEVPAEEVPAEAPFVRDLYGSAEAPFVRDLYGSAEAPFVRDRRGSAAAVMRCAHCALVTSSGQLLGSGAGHRIDRHHDGCVIRMNDAPTAGYERDVGTRTALRVIAHQGIGRFAALSSEPLEGRRVPANVAILHSSWWIRKNRPWIRGFCGGINNNNNNNRSNCFSVRASGFHALYRKETGEDGASQNFMSTGFLAVVMAIESCERVTVYGMVPPDHCATKAARDAPYHYYEPHGPGECEFYLQHEADLPGYNHRFFAEKQVYARWAQTYNITFAHPAWPKEGCGQFRNPSSSDIIDGEYKRM